MIQKDNKVAFLLINKKSAKNKLFTQSSNFLYIDASLDSIMRISNYIKLKFLTMQKIQKAVLGGGCFWCVEAVLQRIKGVDKVVSGYAGGHTKNPTYQQVCSQTTGHAQVCQVTFKPEVLSYSQLLNIFFYVHDPTTLNRQGYDQGTSYRSIILYNSEEQHKIALEVKSQIETEKIYPNPIVTEIKKLQIFYPGEGYHQNYYNTKGSTNPYCKIIPPKIAKFKKYFKDLVDQTKL